MNFDMGFMTRLTSATVKGLDDDDDDDSKKFFH